MAIGSPIAVELPPTQALSAHFGGSWLHLPPMHKSEASQQSASVWQLSNSLEHEPSGGPQRYSGGLPLALQNPVQHSSPVAQPEPSFLHGSSAQKPRLLPEVSSWPAM